MGRAVHTLEPARTPTARRLMPSCGPQGKNEQTEACRAGILSGRQPWRRHRSAPMGFPQPLPCIPGRCQQEPPFLLHTQGVHTLLPAPGFHQQLLLWGSLSLLGSQARNRPCSNTTTAHQGKLHDTAGPGGTALPTEGASPMHPVGCLPLSCNISSG